MHPNMPSKNVRLNVQISIELKDKLNWAAAIKCKKMSVLVRESIELELRRIEKKVFGRLEPTFIKGRFFVFSRLCAAGSGIQAARLFFQLRDRLNGAPQMHPGHANIANHIQKRLGKCKGHFNVRGHRCFTEMQRHLTQPVGSSIHAINQILYAGDPSGFDNRILDLLQKVHEGR
jgi:hypothetical protein